tara:strand:+ start:361 stop:858 length:498 start_codon:yes stop_codon:yes gene_type:complete
MDDDKVVELRPKKKEQPLTAKQLGFIKSILSDENLSQAEAYRRNYSTANMSDSTVWEAASRLFANSKVSTRIKAGRAKQADMATHSGASLRGTLEKELMKIVMAADEDGNPAEPQAIRLKAMDMIGRSAKSAFFLERSTDIPADSLTEEEITAQLQAKLDKAFGT